MSKPLVTIACTTYNHEKYIGQAIESFLNQKTDFPFEIIVHDDASTDNTPLIIQKYADAHPGLIIPILQTENQYSQGKKPFIEFVFPRASGSYIAMCEGDDYWTDPFKLQKQIDFLAANTDYILCYHDAMIIDDHGKIVMEHKLPDNLKKDLTSEELIQGAMILTLTLCFRNVLHEYPEELSKVYNGDKFLTSLLGGFGKGKYMPEIADAVYRRHLGAIWSSLDKIKQLFHNGNTRAWMHRYYKRIGQDTYADYFRNEAVKRFTSTLRKIAADGGSPHDILVHTILCDYPDIIDDATQKRMQKILRRSGNSLSANDEQQISIAQQPCVTSLNEEGPEMLCGNDPLPGQTISDRLHTSDLIYTHQPSMSSTAKINWLLTRRCNYKCSYCSVKDNMNGYFHEIGALKEAVNKLSFINKENLLFSITGGEPTIQPHYIDFLQHIFYTFGKRAFVITVSNLSMPLSFFDNVALSLVDHLKQIQFTASYHFEFANKDRFLENVGCLTHHGISVMVQILAHPEYMDTVKDIYDHLVKMDTDKLAIDIKLIRDIHANPDKNYTEHDLAWLKEYYKESEIKKMNIQLLRQDKKIESLDISPNELIALNRNCFKGFECHAGIEAICINANGDIDPATCFRKIKGNKPNIFKDEDPIGFFQKPVICPFDKCKCLFDLHLSKKHPDYSQIIRLCNAQEIRSIDCMLEGKGWQRKKDRYTEQFESAQCFNIVESPAVSIIVISWRLHHDNLLNFQILDKQRDQNYELIFVDNGGEVGEFEPLKPFIDTYVRLRTNTGAYLARNIGSVFAKAPILIFLEDDGIPEHNFVETHLKAHQKYDVIAVRGVYRPKTDTVINRLADHYYQGDLPFPRPGNLEGNMSYLAKPFFAVGGWDDDIVFGYGGYDLALRLLKIEPDLRKQIYSPDPIIYHDFASNAEHLAAKKKKQENSLQRLKTIHPQWDALLNGWKKYTRRYDLLIYRELPYDTETVERFVNKGKYADAIRYLSRILAEKPEEAAVHNALGVVYSKQGQNGQALKHLLEAVRLESHNATYQKNLAGYYLEQQQLKEAFELYQSIVRFYPEDTDSLMALAGINCILSRFGEAWRLWKTVLVIDPEHKTAQQKLHELESNNIIVSEDTMEDANSTVAILVQAKSMLAGVLQFYEGGHMEKADHQLSEYIQLLKESNR